MRPASVGNDVVDLGDPEARPSALHPRFDARAFGPDERAWIGAGPGAHRRRWSLWAAKEAAFKALRQEDPSVSFVPGRFRVALDACGDGAVALGERRMPVRVRGGADWVHAVAQRGDPGRVRAEVTRVAKADPPATPAELQVAARQRLLASFPAPARLERRGRIPRARLAGGTVAVSLSHHGRFVAFARLEPGAGPA